jgi:multidrug efflux pump subunit AcrA (membrane-fusion protein)
MKKKFSTTAIALFVLFTVSCSKKNEQTAASAPIVVRDVQVGKVTLSSMSDYYEATGTVRAKTSTIISANMMGRIVSIPVREGDQVRAGQLLVEIDSRDAKTQLEKAQGGLKEAQAALIETEQAISAANAAKQAAEANRQLAEVTFKRFQNLLDYGSVSKQSYDEAKAKLDVAKAEVERADKTLQTLVAKKSQVQAKIEQAKADIANAQVYVGYARITSPVNGVITTKQAEVGATATPGTPLLTVEDNSQYRLEAAVEESQLGKARLGNSVQVRIDAIGANELTGTVVEIIPAADPSSRSYTVKIALPANSLLRSGLYGLARFPSGAKQAIAVPQSAVIQRGQLTSVFVVDDAGIARLRLVKTGKISDEQVEILSGLSEGERIVITNAEKLSDGNKVQ